MKHQSKFSPEQQQQHTAEQRSQQGVAREFATAEELLRYDAAHTTVPPGIARRLQKTIGQMGVAPRSWWRNLFGW
jgi:hypothetical protein